MQTKIKKIGNSKGIIIPAAIIKMLGLDEFQKMAIEVRNNKIILSKKNSFNPQSLSELFEGYKEKYQSEIIFDDVKGN